MAGDNGSFEKTDDSWRVARPSENSSGNNQGGFEGELLNEVEIIHLKDDGERSIDDQVGNIVRGVANTGIIVGTALAMPLVALAKNKTRKDGNRYISAKPYQLSEDVGFEQMDGSTKEVGKEVMKATIGTILLALPTTHFWKGQAVTMPVGEGNLSTIEDAVIQDLNATLLCLYGGELNLDYNSMLNVPSIGEEILFLGCEGEEYEEGNLCECEQSTYWAEMAGIECSAIPVMYWYHPDYLGSMEYVTDMTGDPYQFFFNTIWGENLQNQMAFNFKSFSSRFRFNGKEWDEETGNFYYGARYYDPKLSIWLSVDPWASKYPHVTPYNFVENNPIMLWDPTGLGPDEPGEGEPKKHNVEEGDTYYGLANRTYGDDENITVANLKKWNSDVDMDDLQLGQDLNISDPSTNDNASNNSITSDNGNTEEKSVDYPSLEEYFSEQGRDPAQELLDNVLGTVITGSVTGGILWKSLTPAGFVAGLMAAFVTGIYTAHNQMQAYHNSLTPAQNEQRHKNFVAIRKKHEHLTNSE